MTNEEIKKAWNTVKKAMVKKDNKLNGSFRMTAKQMANGTATVCLCNNIEYSEEIADAHKQIKKHESWDDESTTKWVEYYNNIIDHCTERMEKYETKANEAKALAEMITTSKEFKEFQKLTGAKTEIEYTHMWDDLYCYYLRVKF